MAATARISVVIPTHDRGDLVARAVRSVLAQTRPADEVLVVDDCSTDDTPQVLARFGTAVRVLRTADNVERGAARNLGAREATGDAVCFLDSDDEWEPDKLEKQLAVTADGASSVTAVRLVDQDSRHTGRTVTPRPGAQDRLLRENGFFGSPSSILLPRRVVLETGGFPEERELQGSEDWCFLVRLTAAGHRLHVVEQPLVRYRVHASNSTGNPDALARSMWAAVRWMTAQGLVPPDEQDRLEVRTAGVIARAYAARRRTADASRWGRRCLSPSVPGEAARALALVAASTGRSWLRRG